MEPPKTRDGALKERPFHNDWFFLSSYILLGIFLVAQVFLVFWPDLVD